MDEAPERTSDLNIYQTVGGLLLLGAIALTSLYSFPLFHTVAELFGISVAIGIFMIVWNSRRFVVNDYLLFIAIAGLFVAAVDLLHTVAYHGVGVFPTNDSNIASQLWVVGRYLQAASFLIAPVFLSRRLKVSWTFIAFAALAAVPTAAIFAGVFPTAYVTGQGLTMFKNVSEYLIIGIFAGAFAFLYRRRDSFEPIVARLLLGAIAVYALAEGLFTMYVNVYGGFNLAGHLVRIAGIYLVYRAIIVTALARPYGLLFRDLKLSEEALRGSEERFRTTFEQAHIGIANVDLGGRWMRVNDRLCEIVGRSREDLAHLTSQEITWPEDLERELLLIERLRSGEIATYSIEKRYVRPDGSPRWVQLSRSLFRDDYGMPGHFIAVLEDIQFRKDTEAREQREKELSDALNAINAEIGSTLDAEAIMQRVVTRSAEATGADAVSLTLRDGDLWVQRYSFGFGDDIIGRSFTDEELPIHVLAERTRGPVAVEDSSEDRRVNPETMRALGITAFLAVPLACKDEVIGVLGFASRTTGAFAPAEVDFATKLAASVSLALENARLYAVEHRIADTLQEALLSPPIQMPGLTFGQLYRSATVASRVGGDFYDLFEVSPGVAGIIVGDVSGKGLEAAALTAIVKTAIKAHAMDGLPPAEVMARVNEFVRRESDAGSFATVFFGTLDLTTGALAYCSAGHPPAIIRRANGSACRLATTSPLVGAFEDLGYRSDAERLYDGDILVLYTDGVTECRREGELFGEERLVAFLETADAPADALPALVLEEIKRFSGGVLADDIALLALSRD